MSVGQRSIVSLKARRFTRKYAPKQRVQILRPCNDGVHVSEIMQIFSAARPMIYKGIKETSPAGAV